MVGRAALLFSVRDCFDAGRARARTGLARAPRVLRAAQTVKELPQPQPPLELGLLKVNPDPWKVET